MSYRSLLDPKGAAKEKAKAKASKRSPYYGPQQSRKAPEATMDETTMVSPKKFDPRALLDPRAAASKAKTASPPSLQAGESAPTDKPPQNSQASSGMGDLLGRLHNLGEREAPLHLKRKAEVLEPGDDEQPEKAKSSTFTGVKSSGELGEYLKMERKKGAAEAIDLTGEDDDDIVLMGDNSNAVQNEEVCLGMIHSRAIAWQIPNGPKFQQSNKLGKGLWPQSKLNYRRSPSNNTIMELFSPTMSSSTGTLGVKLGNLDGKLATVLCPLLDSGDVTKMRLKIYLDPFERKPGESPGSRISRSLNLRVVIYAPRKKAETIGRFLSQRQFFFSDPTFVDQGIRVENPQVPKIHGPLGTQARSGVHKPSATYVSRTQEEILRETSDMFDSLVKAENLPEKEVSGDLIQTPLLAHQKQALHFMLQHEEPSDHATFSLWKPKEDKNKTAWYNVITNHQVDEKPAPSRGGILADVMGLGKTLSILALIAETRITAKEFGKQDAPKDDEQVLLNSKATLIICPKSVMANWEEQIKTHTKTKAFKVYAYHGTTRTQDVQELAGYDIVLTPYQTAAAEFGDAKSKRSALASTNWFRIVLDEAHMIRNPTTNVSKAACRLSGERRWAVTGTPVQNRLDDLGALIKFLRIKPFDDGTSWSQHIIAPFRAASEHVIAHLRLLVDGITLRRLKDTIGLTDRTQIRERLTFSDEEMAVYGRFARDANRKLRIMIMETGRLQGKGYAHVLKSLGRLRAICAHGREMLSEDDQKELDGLTAATAIDLGDEPTDDPSDEFVSEKLAYDTFSMMVETNMNHCAACDRNIGEHRNDAREEADETSDDEDDISSDDESDDILGYMLPCFQLICPDCKDTHIEVSRSQLTADHYHTCAYCEQYTIWGMFELTRGGLRNILEARSAKSKNKKAKWDESTYSGPHTKVKALLQELEVSARETAALREGEPPIRSVVFSSWTTYLDLIEHALEENSIGSVRIDGSMSVRARTAALTTFSSDPNVTVLLVSIKAGGQGLNFTAANKVYMMEPQFNPGVELQAMDRVHRLGQKRPVTITHYIMKDSVEEKIVILQEKKEKLAKLSMERTLSRAEEAKRKIAELKELFK